MTVSFKPICKAVFRILRNILQKTAACLSALFSLMVSAIIILFLTGIKPYVVTTGSMSPAIPVYSICFVNENTPFKEISVGDVITFRTGDNLHVTHRVTAISGDTYITRGDANNMDDSPVTAEKYIGKTVFVVPKIGIVLVYLHTGTGKIAAASLIILLLIPVFLPDKTSKETEQQPPEQKPKTDA